MSEKNITEFNLLEHNTYKLTSHAQYVYYPKNVNEIKDIIKQHENIFILGNGSNVIFTQKIYSRIAFIILTKNFNHYEIKQTTIEAYAGATLKKLSLIALDHQLSNLEVFYDIPATVGGALWMNAGAYGESIFDYVKEVTTLNKSNNKINIYPISKIEYGYRYSMFQDSDEIILSAKFILEKKPYPTIKDKMERIYSLRNSNLPKEHSAGSVFKRPNYHITVGEMVERLGLKGHAIGGAMISNQHGGIIINTGHASAEDILSLIKLIQSKVKEYFQVELSLEQIPI